MKLLASSLAVAAAVLTLSVQSASAESTVLQQQYKFQRALDGVQNVETRPAFSSRSVTVFGSKAKTALKAKARGKKAHNNKGFSHGYSGKILSGPARAHRNLNRTQPRPSGN